MRPLLLKLREFRLSDDVRRVLLGLALLGVTLLLLPRFRPDFVQSYAAALGWWRGEDTNARTADLLAETYPELAPYYPAMQTAHPPLATLVALPFALMAWPYAQLLWLFVGWLAIMAAWQLVRVDPLACLATAPFWVLALGLGTHEPLLFLLLAVALRCDGQQQVRADGCVGLAIGFAAVLKVYPALFIVGLGLARRWRAVVVAVSCTAMLMLLSEVIIGGSATRKWADWLPVNTLRYADSPDNLSLVRLVRRGWPQLSPATAALVLLVVLTLPLLRRIERGDWLRPLLPVVLLAAPLAWRQYLGLLGLVTLRPVEQWCLLAAGTAALLVGMELLPMSLALMLQVPAILVLLLVWLRAVRQPTIVYPAGPGAVAVPAWPERK